MPLGERWLERRAFACPELAERLAWWRERERSFVERAPLDLEEPGPRLDREARGLCELWLPVERIAREAHALLRAHFDLASRDACWRDDLLARAPSWIDARLALRSLPALPSVFLGSLVDPDHAEALVFESHDPPSFGHGAGRYPRVLERIAAFSPRAIWDAGCGTGETTFELARLAGAVLGTTPCPWELLMARRRGRPHDRARTFALRARTEDVTNVRFERGDLRRGAPGTGTVDDGGLRPPFDGIFVGGVLGGVLAREDDVTRALGTLRGALEPGGRVWIADRFREDRHARARSLVERLARAIGFAVRRDEAFLELSVE
jgi:SAM-dependent methyltransferase